MSAVSWVQRGLARAKWVLFCLTVMSTNHSQQVIDTLTGQHSRAGARLHSVTNEIYAYRVLDHESYGDKLVLVDTLAFDDTFQSEGLVLGKISHWMVKTYVGVSVQEPE